MQIKLRSVLKHKLLLGEKNAKALILIDENSFDVHQISKAFQEVFKNELKSVFLVYSKSKIKTIEQTTTYISASDFHFKKSVLSEKASHITNDKFQFVFQLFTKNQIYLNYISAIAKANLRISLRNCHEKITDLTINQEELDWNQFFEESKKYIYSIQK